MIVTLDAHADRDAVLRALVGRGLWVKPFEANGVAGNAGSSGFAAR